MRGLETRRRSPRTQFGERFGELLELERTGAPGSSTACSAASRPDDADGRGACAARAAHGIRTGLISNSMGAGRYDRSTFPELFDGVVISGDVGLHKPQPEIFVLGASASACPPADCVFVDDLRENCEGAEAVGMTAVLHRGAERTLPRARGAARRGAAA